jgi:hypothetical protein
MLNLLAWVEVPAVIADNPAAVAILGSQATETAKDIGMEIDGEPEVTDGSAPGQKVVLWKIK